MKKYKYKMYKLKTPNFLSVSWISWLCSFPPLLFFSGIIQSQVLCCSENKVQLLAGSKTPSGEVAPSINEGRKKSGLAQGEASEKEETAHLLSKF